MAQLNPQAPNAILELIQSPRIQLTPFDPAEGTFGQWLQLFDEACISARVRDEPMENDVILPAHNHKRAYFLSSVGRRAYAVLQKECLPNLPNTKTIPELSEILRQHFEPQGTQAAYDLAFSTRDQYQNETVVQYIAELQALAEKCNFGPFWERAQRSL